MKNFTDDIGITGHLTIIKQFPNGEEEVVFDDHNIIVSGMGVGLSYMFNGSGSTSVLDYQIDRFQIGVSGPPAGGVTSAIQGLSGALNSVSEYGTGSNLFIEDASQIKGDNIVANQFFALIPANKITRIDDASVRYTLVVDEEACNGLTRDSNDMNINEIGLLMKNPTGNTGTNRSILVAYRTFSNIRKTNDFSLIFRWTLNF
tara:strand:- start:19350 stop:19958 length:609 start_codon:yes stop_codon:yes gene_type:complete